MRINEIERGVLKVLVAARESDSDFYFKNFASIKRSLPTYVYLDRAAIRRACRSLSRKGLAEYGKGLWNDDGEVAGAGYAATREGAKALVIL
jgi:predicted GNAT superfamily acetyltransferase